MVNSSHSDKLYLEQYMTILIRTPFNRITHKVYIELVPFCSKPVPTVRSRDIRYIAQTTNSQMMMIIILDT